MHHLDVPQVLGFLGQLEPYAIYKIVSHTYLSYGGSSCYLPVSAGIFDRDLNFSWASLA